MANTQSGNTGMTYIDKGDVAAVDFAVGDFIIDNAWHDLDLSGIVPVGTVLVLARIYVVAATSGKLITFICKGYVNNLNHSRIQTQVANVGLRGDIWLRPDANGIIEYKIAVATWPAIDLVIRGYFKQ